LRDRPGDPNQPLNEDRDGLPGFPVHQ